VPDIQESRAYAQEQLRHAPPAILGLKEARPYRVGLESSLHELRSTLIARAEEQQCKPK